MSSEKWQQLMMNPRPRSSSEVILPVCRVPLPDARRLNQMVMVGSHLPNKIQPNQFSIHLAIFGCKMAKRN